MLSFQKIQNKNKMESLITYHWKEQNTKFSKRQIQGNAQQQNCTFVLRKWDNFKQNDRKKTIKYQNEIC